MKTIITKIEVQKRDKTRVNVYINDEFAFACSMELVYTHNLKKDMEVEKEQLYSVVQEDNYLQGKKYALKVLEKTYKTEGEIKEKLYKKGYEDKEVNRIIDFLKEYKFIDDIKYVDMFIKDKIKNTGRNKIKYDLLRKGIEEDLLNEKINSINYEEEFNNGLSLSEKKFNQLKKSENNRAKLYKKIGDFLVRNGYDFQIVNEVIYKLKNYECNDCGEEENYFKDKIDNNSVNENCIMKSKRKLEILNETNEEDKVNQVNEEQQEEEISTLALKRYNIILKSERDYVKVYKKLLNYLLRRGYPYDIVNRVVREMVQEE